jgi:hypothetical protein
MPWRIPWPVTGNQTPPRIESAAVRPPIAGPIESGVSRCPKRMPSAANGISPTRSSSVICTHSFAVSRTPSTDPAV